jgi:hypothetical protein
MGEKLMRCTFANASCLRAVTLGLSIGLGVIGAGTVSAQTITTVVAEPLKPVEFGPTLGRAALPDHVEAGYQIDFAGELIIGDWQGGGVITVLSESEFTFESSDGRVGHFVYRLRGERELQLEVGQGITLSQSQGFDSKVQVFQLVVETPEHLILSARRAHYNVVHLNQRDLALATGINGEQIGLALRPLNDRKTVRLETEYGQSYDVPVALIETAGGNIVGELTANGTELVELQESAAFVDIEISSYFTASAQHRGLTPDGYVLEYFVALER